jgi:hypothetical protein
MKNDPDGEAQSLSMLVKLLGRNPRKIAIIERNDDRRLLAYQREDYEIIKMNGDRDSELRQFILRMENEVQDARPKHMVLVSEDPQFVHLCNMVAPLTDLAVWANSASAPRELRDAKYGWRPLEELLPNLKIPLIDVRLDLENIFIGLVQRGWRPNLHELIKAIHTATSDLGEVVNVTGYADFDELNRHHGGPNMNWQRELTLAKAESRYVINQHGKNTADMKIADDIRTLVEHDPSASGAIDIIGLATMDRDFRPIVETAQRRGKRVVVLGLERGVSRELETVASEVRYLDKYLKLAQPITPGAQNAAMPRAEDVTLMMRVAAWMHNNRWRFVYRDRLEEQFPDATETLKKLIANGWLTPTASSSLDVQGQARVLEVNPDNTTARAAHHLARWIPERVDYCLNKRGMPHVDSNFLATGMARDAMLTQLGIARTRPAAENWLQAAASAGLIVASEQPHSQNLAKLITTWRLPEEVTLQSAAEANTVAPIDSAPTTRRLRELLTHGLSDAELTTMLFDHFLEVHRAIEGAPKYERIQALLDYVERRGQQYELLAAICKVNPALGEEPEARPLAA